MGGKEFEETVKLDGPIDLDAWEDDEAPEAPKEDKQAEK